MWASLRTVRRLPAGFEPRGDQRRVIVVAHQLSANRLPHRDRWLRLGAAPANINFFFRCASLSFLLFLFRRRESLDLEPS